jgi:hypothetical protein
MAGQGKLQRSVVDR